MTSHRRAKRVPGARRVALAAAGVLGLVLAAGGCGDDDGTAGPTSAPPTEPPATAIDTTAIPTTNIPATTTITSTVPTTTAPVTTPAITSTYPTTIATTAPVTTPATGAAPTTVACGDAFGLDPVVVDYPMTLSSLVGADIRTGAHPCFERVVIELAGTGGMPGYRVAYVDDPVHLSPSDLVVDIAGDATLVASVGAWMTSIEGDGYSGPTQLFPTNVTHIVELRLIENFEGMHAWAIGLDQQRGFRVTTLADPPRIVIDIATRH